MVVAALFYRGASQQQGLRDYAGFFIVSLVCIYRDRERDTEIHTNLPTYKHIQYRFQLIHFLHSVRGRFVAIKWTMKTDSILDSFK